MTRDFDAEGGPTPRDRMRGGVALVVGGPLAGCAGDGEFEV